MGNINILDQNTINQIAAGEVIERPSAVVKELVENAIDAKASGITVEIKSGGIDFIRITDNGSGILEEDVPYVFLRHSTSKIKTALDLLNVSSLGFRGEALSSIAAISKVELVTKTSDALSGIRYLISGGEEERVEQIGCPGGTTIIVRDLFYNTPARRKFLKSATTEAGHISDFMNRIAASHPSISFKFINNNQIKLHTSGNGNRKDVIYHVYGRDIAANLIPVKANSEDVSIDGFIGAPKVSRGNRNYENYYLNGRYIKSSLITKAIEEAFKPYTMNHRYPFTSFDLQVDGELVDVNVHPTKLEVRFHNSSKVYDFIYQSIKNALEEKELIHDVALTQKKEALEPKIHNIPEPFEKNRRSEVERNREFEVRDKSQYEIKDKSHNENATNWIQEVKENKQSEFLYAKNKYPSNKYKSTPVERIPTEFKKDIADSKPDALSSSSIKETEIGKLKEVVNNPKEIMAEKSEQMSFLSEEAKNSHRIIGQVFLTYWLIEFDGKLYIIDQHAAHEKVLYEKIIKDLDKKSGSSQLINPPIILSFTMAEEEMVKKYQEELSALGFEIEEFGGNEYAVRGVPNDLYGLAQQDILVELIDNLSDEINHGTPDILLEKIASISCKAAVKGHQKLSVREVYALIDELLELDNPYHCPHGRPTMIAISKYELEKKFKRIL